MTWEILEGDCRAILRGLEAESVQTCITSPPYWGLRDYDLEPSVWGGEEGCDHIWGERILRRETNHIGTARWQHTRNGRDEEQPAEKRVAWRREAVPQGQFCERCGAWLGCLGLEPDPDLYVAHLVEVFREVWRVLRPDGTLWLNLGDCFATGAGRIGPESEFKGKPVAPGEHQEARRPRTQPNRMPIEGLKAKDLVGVPWRAAFALQADGWWLRSEIIWAKPNPMPESVQDRPTRAHEQIFLLAKARHYVYDRAAILEPSIAGHGSGSSGRNGNQQPGRGAFSTNVPWEEQGGRNRRSVWSVMTRPFPEAHFATFPPKLVEPCLLAGAPPRVCGICGTAWRRLIESEFIEQPDVASPEALARDPEGLDPSSRWGGTPRGSTDLKTLGWEPRCDHDDDSGQGVVLDPFSGAGTTLLVAEMLGRRSIGIEASPEYAEMARARIRRWEANPAGALEGAAEPLPGQLDLSSINPSTKGGSA